MRRAEEQCAYRSSILRTPRTWGVHRLELYTLGTVGLTSAWGRREHGALFMRLDLKYITVLKRELTMYRISVQQGQVNLIFQVMVTT